MTPSFATRRRRRRNAAVGGTGVTARALAAGLWRNHHSSSSPATLLGNNRRRTHCPCSRNHEMGSSSMEKATKWAHLDYYHDIPSAVSTRVALELERELERARAQIVELEEEKRVTSKRLERFLRKLEQEKSRLKEDLRLEGKHRRELESANGKLLTAAKQQAQRYETERKARELMEEACSELTREVEEDQAEVELLRRECLRMREEMEEERRMLQMAEVWREERVQMKLSDAKLALERKYSQLNRLQDEMETFLSVRRIAVDVDDAKVNGEGSSRPLMGSLLGRVDRDKVDVDSVFEHFRRKEEDEDKESSSSTADNLAESVSPATDLFLAKAGDGDDAYSDDGSCSWLGTASDPSVSVAPATNESSFSHNNNDGAGRRSGAIKNTALIRRLWRTAIADRRKEPRDRGAQANAWLPPLSSDRNKGPSVAAAAAERCSSTGSVNQQQQREQRQKRSLKEKLMEARMDDQNPSDQKHY